MRLIAVVLTVMTVGAIAVSGVAVAQETPGTGEDADAQQSSYLRVIHAASDAPAVDVTVDNETIATDVEAGNATDYVQFAAGNHSIQVTAADADANASGEVLFEGTIYLEQRTTSTLALTADQTAGGAAETPTENETEMGDATEDNETTFGENETEDNETTFGGNATENETALVDNETEDNETTFGENETEDNETTFGDNETEDNETTFGDNATEDNETTFGENETEEGGAATAPTNDSQQVTSLTPVMYVDNAWEPGQNEAALSILHFAEDAEAVDVTIEANETDADATGVDENATENETVDNATNGTSATEANNLTVVAEDLEYRGASDYVQVPAGEHTLQIRQASDTNDGQIIATVNVTVEGGNAYSALVMGNESASNQTAGGAAETPTDDETTLGDNETEDNETAFGENETEDNETTFGDNATEDNETTFGENETEDNETTFGDNETEDNETTLGDNETEDNETELGDTTTESQVSLNVSTVQDVTYSVNVPGQDMADNETTDAGDDEADDADEDEEDNPTSISLGI